MYSTPSSATIKTSAFRRPLTLILLATFIVTNHFEIPLARATPPPEGAMSTLTPNSLPQVTIPESIGTVQEVFIGRGDSAVVLVQDAHAIPGAQENIRKLIDYFQKEKGLRLIAVEGASTELDPTLFKTFPDTDTLEAILQQYHHHGELSGSTAAAIFNESPSVYHGVEDWNLYEEGLKHFLDARGMEESHKERLGILFDDLSREKRRHYSKDLLEIDGALQTFRKNETDLITLLEKLAAVRLPEKGSELTLLLEGVGRSRKNDSSIDAEVRDIADQIRSFLKKDYSAEAKQDLLALNQKFQESQTSRIIQEAYALFLKGLAVKYRISVKVSKRLNYLIGNQKRMKDIQGTKLFDDLEKYAQSVKGTLLQNDEERRLDVRSHQLGLMERLALLELSRRDWNEVKGILRQIEYWNITTDGVTGTGDIVRLLKSMQLNLDFYHNAEERERAFLQSVSSLKQKYKTKSAMLIAGGFHTEGISYRLKSQGVSYMLVMPKIDTIPSEVNYREQMQGRVSWQGYFKVQDGRVNLHDAFVRGTRDLLLHHSKEESSRLVKLWRDELIRYLADEKRLTSASEYTRFIDEVIRGKDGADALYEEWITNINRFMDAVYKLESQGQLTEQHILNLFSSPTIPAGATAAPIARSELRAELMPYLEEIRFPPMSKRIPKPGIDQADTERHGTPANLTVATSNILRSEVRNAENQPGEFENYLKSGIDFERTLPVYRDKGIFIEAAEQGQKKSLEEIRRDIDDEVAARHEKMRWEDGYLPRDLSKEVDKLYEIFERVVRGYNRLARERELPEYRGKLFLVDAPLPNAFVFSEHEDVYFYIGDVQETARYLQAISKETGEDIPLTEELVALTFAHELGHVFQGTSYEGIGFSQLVEEDRSHAAILDLKRQMEYDADRMAIAILDASEYSSRPVLTWLNFLVRITPEGTAEHAVSDHPHPKLRVAHIAQHLNEAKLVTNYWEGSVAQNTNFREGLHLLDKETYSVLETGHAHHHAHLLNAFDEVDRAALSANSPQQMMEYAALADEKASLASMKAFADTEEARIAYAKQVYMQNVINVAERMVREALEEDSQMQVKVEEINAPLNKVFLSQNIKAGVHMLEEILSEELSRWITGKASLSDRDRKNLGERMEETLKRFKLALETALKTIQDSQLGLEQKMGLVQKLLVLARDSKARLLTVHADSFESALSSDTSPDFEDAFLGFMSSVMVRQKEFLDLLDRIPFSVFDSFGKTTLDRKAALNTGSFGNFKKPIGSMKEEIEDSGFYRSNPGLWEITASEAKSKAYDGSRYAWSYERMSQAVTARSFRKRHFEHFMRLVDERLEQSGFYDRDSDKENVGRKTRFLFEIFFMRGWDGLVKRVRSQPGALDFFMDAAFEAGITKPEHMTVSRSAIYNRENGLDRKPITTLAKKREADLYPVVAIHGSGVKPRKQYEASENGEAYHAIREDYTQRAKDNLGIETLLTVLDDHLSVYAPYFRKRLLQQMIDDKYFLTGIKKPRRQRKVIKERIYEKDISVDLNVSQLWFEEKNLQEIHDWMEQKVGPRDAHELMILFLRQVDWQPVHDELSPVDIVLAEDQEFPWYQEEAIRPPLLDLEKARGIIVFFEKYYVTGRLEDKGWLEEDLVRKYLDAKLGLYQLEHPGQTPPPDMLYEDLLRISAHVPIRMTSPNFSLADKENPPNSLKGIYSKREIKNPKLLEENFAGMLFRNPVNVFEAAYFRQIFALNRRQLQQIASNQNLLQNKSKKQVGRFSLHWSTGDSLAGASDPVNFKSLLNALILRRIIQEESGSFSNRKFQPVLMIRNIRPSYHKWASADEVNMWRFQRRSWLRILLEFLWPIDVLVVLLSRFFKPSRFYSLGVFNSVAYARRAYRFRDSVAVQHFWKKLAEGFVMDGSTDDFIHSLSKSWKYLRWFPIFSRLLTDSFDVPSPDIQASLEPVSYIKYLARQVKAGGIKGALFKAFGRRRKLLDISGPVPPRERVDELAKALQSPSSTRDGILDIWERTLLPEIHRYSAITRRRLHRMMRPSWFQTRKQHEKLFDDFLGDGLIEVPLEWENLENQSLKIPSRRAAPLLEFYNQAIPLILDPQRQLRYGATAMKIWRAHHPETNFAEELEAIEAFFPKPSKYRDRQLDLLFEVHEIPVNETRLLGSGAAIALDRYAERLYATYQRLEYDEEWTHGDAIYQVVQSMLSLTSREDRKEVLLWLLNPQNALPKIFRAIKEQKNIEFDDLPKHLKYAPEVLKQEILSLILTGENGLLNPRLPEDREVKRDFSLAVFDYFFPPNENDPVKTGIQAEDLALIREIFATAMDHFEQGRASLMIQDMMSMQTRLREMPLGMRMTFLLSSFGPVGVKIGQFLSENQQLIPNAYLRSQLASLRDNAKPISKLAVLRAIAAAGFLRGRVRLKQMLGAASMKVVYEGEYQTEDGIWHSVVFKVLRPSLGRMITQDLDILDKTLNSPTVLEKILVRLRNFKPETVVSAVKRMIDVERDFIQEKSNAEMLAQTESDANDHRDEGTFPGSVPLVLAVKGGVIIEEKAAGIEVGKFLGFRPGWKRALGFAHQALRQVLRRRGLSETDASGILGLSTSDVIRSARRHFLHQLFEVGVFHADPHGGNIILGTGGTLHFIDPGLVGQFNHPQKRIRVDIDQKKAARHLMKAVLTQDQALLMKSIDQIVHVEGGSLASPVNELESKIEEIFEENQGNLGQFLNQFGALMLTQIQGSGSETVSHFIKAMSQGLWMFPMTPWQGLSTLRDLSEALSLNAEERKLVIQKTVMPYLMKTYLNPLKWIRALKERIDSIKKDILRWFKDKWSRFKLALDVLRLRRQVRKVAGLFSTSASSGPAGLMGFGGFQGRAGQRSVATFFFGESLKPAEKSVKRRKIFKKIKSADPAIKDKEVLEAAKLYAEYSALLSRVHLNAPEKKKLRKRKRKFMIIGKGGRYGSVMPAGGHGSHYSSDSGGSTKTLQNNEGNYFHLGLPSLRPMEREYLQFLDPFLMDGSGWVQGNNRVLLPRAIEWSPIAETLTRRFLEDKYGDEAVDFSVFNRGLARHWSDQYTDLYLAELDVLDETRELLRLGDGTPISRRNMLMQRFQAAAPESKPVLQITEKKGQTDDKNVFTGGDMRSHDYWESTGSGIKQRESDAPALAVTSYLSLEPVRGKTLPIAPAVEDIKPDFLTSSHLRRFLKRNSALLREPGSHLLRENKGVLIFAVRNLYSYSHDVKTVHLNLYSAQDDVNAAVDLTESEYYRYLKKGELPATMTVTRYRTAQPASRSEVRFLSHVASSLALELMPSRLKDDTVPRKAGFVRWSSKYENALGFEHLLRTEGHLNARNHVLRAAAGLRNQIQYSHESVTDISAHFAEAVRQAREDLLLHFSEAKHASQEPISVAIRRVIKPQDSFLVHLTQILRAYGHPVQVIAEKDAFNAMPNTGETYENIVRSPITAYQWKKGVALLADQDEAPLANDEMTLSLALSDMFTGFLLDLTSVDDVLTRDFSELLFAASLIELAKIYAHPHHKKELAKLKADPLKRAEYLKTQLLQNLAGLGYSEAMFSLQNGRFTLMGKVVQEFLARSEIRKSA